MEFVEGHPQNHNFKFNGEEVEGEKNTIYKNETGAYPPLFMWSLCP